MRYFFIVFSIFLITSPFTTSAKDYEVFSVLELQKSGMISVPSLEDDTSEEALQTLRSSFEIQEITIITQNKNEISYSFTSLLLGKIIITPYEGMVLSGLALPLSEVSFIVASHSVLTNSDSLQPEDMKSEYYTTSVDALGLWHIAIDGATLAFGDYALVGMASYENNVVEKKFGGITIANEATHPNILDDSTLQETQLQVTSPTIATMALLNTTAAIPILGFLPYLAYLFSEPLSIIFRKRRTAWGIVYDSLTKQPLDLAVVRLYDTKTKKLITTRVTDSFGRYNFVVDPGIYFIEVHKPSYVFPSHYLKGKTEDAKYTKLYYGEKIRVTSESDNLVSLNIPLDVNLKEKPYRHIILGYLLHQTQKGVSLIGPIFALVSLIIQPTLLFLGLFLLHIILYVLFRRFTYTPAVKTFGNILDAKTKTPLGNVVVKLFSTEYNKLLDTKVTSSKGQYNFLVGENEYFITAEKTDYSIFKSPPIKIRKGENGIISEDVEMLQAT